MIAAECNKTEAEYNLKCAREALAADAHFQAEQAECAALERAVQVAEATQIECELRLASCKQEAKEARRKLEEFHSPDAREDRMSRRRAAAQLGLERAEQNDAKAAQELEQAVAADKQATQERLEEHRRTWSERGAQKKAGVAVVAHEDDNDDEDAAGHNKKQKFND